MELLSPESLAIVPLTIGLVAVIKSLGTLAQYAPVASVLTGAAPACFVAETIPKIVLGGTAIGLMAFGLYSGTKAVFAG
jgi:hypothetical protein